MNDAFIAMQRRDELSDTLFFAGFKNEYTKEMVRGKRAYVFKNEGWSLTISGNAITIDDKKMRNVAEAKVAICQKAGLT